MEAKCELCNGTGLVIEATNYKICPNCKGEGCSECNDKGYLEKPSPCSNCKGTGKVRK